MWLIWEKKYYPRQDAAFVKGGDRPKLAPGELWKAQQLKEYRRAQGLCFKCGDKYAPGHVCVKPDTVQLQALEVQQDNVILSDAILDAIIAPDLVGMRILISLSML